MNLRAYHLVVSFLMGAVVLASLALLTVAPPEAQAACPTGSGVAVTYPTTTATGPLSGVVTLKAESTPTTATGLTFMLLSSTQQAIGEATQSGSSWNLSWDTRNQPNGGYSLMAIAHFSNASTLDCASAAVPFAINNTATQAPKLTVTVNPNTWQGIPGATAAFNLDAQYTDQYGRTSHVSAQPINWFVTPPSLGTVAPNGGPSTLFTAGTALGTGGVGVSASYAGLNATGGAQIKVVAATSGGSGTTNPSPTPTPPPTPSSTPPPGTTSPTPSPSPVSAADAARLSSMPTIFRPADPTNSDPVVAIPTLSCMEKAVGAVRFAEISGGKSQPTAVERKLAAACFSGPEQIPAVLAPVAPSTITDVPKTTGGDVSVGSIKNQTTTSADGKKITGLLITGTGAPNSDIYIYVFSDPLVLRAQTDSQGKWSYVLENPLKSGHHEVYAVAEKDSGNFVRTSAVPIQVAAAAPGSQDGTLVVEGAWSTAQIGFAGGAGLLVVAALFVLFRVMRRHGVSSNVPAAAPMSAPESAPAAPAPATVVMPTTVQPMAPAPPATPAPEPPVPESQPPSNPPANGPQT
ncbi:MAG TPA: hypothetical protein VHQ86_05260 [Candidatus Saccharimonadia bacterium]|nr:hypothetical protein [Candidatus Saccharimonadia bacterium]